jgi:hypothetical protein
VEVDPLGAHAIVERRQRDDGPFRRLDEHERRGQAAIALRADEIAARERIAEQHLVVARIENGAPAADSRPAGTPRRIIATALIRAAPSRRRLSHSTASAASGQTRGHTPRRALLSTGPGELVTTDLEAVVRRAHRQMIRREAIGVSPV